MAKLRVDKIAAPIVKDEFTGSVFFDGTGDYLSISDSTDFDLGISNEPFTMELWFYKTAAAGTHCELGLLRGGGAAAWNGSNGHQYRGFQYTDNKLYWQWWNGSANKSIISSATPAINTWHHFAVSYDGATTRAFLNGVIFGTSTEAYAKPSASNITRIGQDPSNSVTTQGYQSNVRVCKGHAVYTGNFTVPTRELPVHTGPPKGIVFPAADNRTVLLACQSSTDATADTSGRHTLTANGDVHAQSANPGLFRKTNITSTITENTGSVFFDGTDDRLDIASSTDFRIADSNTFECWINYNSLPGNNLFLGVESSYWVGYNHTGVGGASNKFVFTIYNGSSWQAVSSSTTPVVGTWYHLAAIKDGTSLKMFINGALENTTTMSGTAAVVNDFFNIGKWNQASAGQGVNGYLSNVRICKGHAVYKSQFIPPTRELEVHEGPDDDRTVLLACYDGENIFADKTGRHIIAAYGDRLSSPTPTATDSPIGITTNYPPVTRNVDPTDGPTFQGGAGFVSQNWLTLPKGTTAERFVEVANNAVSASSARGINGGGYIAPNNTNTMQYITIATTGNGADFGDLTAIRNTPGAVASSTRGIWMGGTGPSPSNTALNTIDYATISTLGNAADFGDLINNHRADSAAGNSTRGLRLGQQQSPAVGNTIEYITIASTGDAKDFGDLVQGRSQSGAFASPTRAVQIGGYGGPSTGNVNTIDYVTIQTMGNSIEFGDLKDGIRTGARGCSNATRGVFGGGYNPTPYASDLDYVTIASTGNSQDFGNLSMGNRYGSSCSSLTRGIFFIGESTSPTPGQRQEIDYVELATLANANDFGDLINSYSGYIAAACSSGHGGLG